MHKVVATYPGIRSKQTMILGILVASLLLVMALAQLFGFEELSGILARFWAIDESWGLLLAAILVICEVFALPALLGMKLSLLMRWCSGAAGGLVAAYWVVASLYVASSSLVRDSGVFGGKIETVSSLFLPVVSVMLVALLWAYWASVAGVDLRQSLKKSISKG